MTSWLMRRRITFTLILRRLFFLCYTVNCMVWTQDSKFPHVLFIPTCNRYISILINLVRLLVNDHL